LLAAALFREIAFLGRIVLPVVPPAIQRKLIILRGDHLRCERRSAESLLISMPEECLFFPPLSLARAFQLSTAADFVTWFFL
jgi:hypothetical protein